jgi:hypothetical protein
LVIGAEERGSSEGVLKALVICEHRELMLSASPSTSGTARQTEKGSRLFLKSGVCFFCCAEFF